MEDKIVSNKPLEILESIIFDQEELDALKKKIDQVSKGQLKAVELKKAILDYRATIFERILIFFQFNRNLFGNKSNNSKNHELQAKYKEINKMLKERNGFLESVGTRIANICAKLKSYLEN